MDSTNDKTTLEIKGMAWANSLLENSVEWLNTFGANDFLNGKELSQQASAVLVVGHAIIQQQERIAIERNERLGVLIESVDVAGIKPPLTDSVKITVMPAEVALNALIMQWHILNPHPKDHTLVEYHEAVAEFKKLLGL